MRRKWHYLNRKLALGQRRQISRLLTISGHPFAVPITAFIMLVVISLVGIIFLISRGVSIKPAATDIVIISYDRNVQTVPSHEPTVGALLTKLHITIHEGDVVEPTLTTRINQDDFRINVYRAVPVKIIDHGIATFAYNAATTPRAVAAQAGITVYPEDALSQQPVSNILQEGTLGKVVVIDRSLPITLTINGLATPTRTLSKTVGDFLTEKKIKLAKHDSVMPTANTPIVAGQTINLVRDGVGIQSQTVAIAMPIQTINDDSLSYGTSAVRQAGSPGEEVLTYKITVKSGQVVDKQLLQTVVTVSPVTEIVVRGTNLSGIKGDMARAGISPDDYQYADYIISHESGWCPTKAQGEHYCPAIPDNQYTPNGYGLCQATPGSKMASAGTDWATNPVTQLSWCSGYASARYGGWANAYNHWVAYHSW